MRRWTICSSNSSARRFRSSRNRSYDGRGRSTISIKLTPASFCRTVSYLVSTTNKPTHGGSRSPPPPSAHTHVRTRAYHFVPCTGGEPVLSSPVLDERSNPCSESRGLLIAISNGGRKGYWGAIMCILRSRSLLVRPFSFCRQMD